MRARKPRMFARNAIARCPGNQGRGPGSLSIEVGGCEVIVDMLNRKSEAGFGGTGFKPVRKL